MARDPVIPPMDLAPGELAKRLMQPSKDAKHEDAPKSARQDGAPVLDSICRLPVLQPGPRQSKACPWARRNSASLLNR